jgi:hypothetical protein
MRRDVWSVTPRERATGCSNECWLMPRCDRCGLTKKPRGRSAPLESSYCDDDCDGYYKEPKSGHHWPQEKCDDYCPKS